MAALRSSDDSPGIRSMRIEETTLLLVNEPFPASLRLPPSTLNALTTLFFSMTSLNLQRQALQRKRQQFLG